MKGRIVFLGLILLAVATIAAAPGGALRQAVERATGVESRDPASVPTPVPITPARVVAEGRVVAYPGAEVVVGTEVAGRIVKLDVTERTKVTAGQVIAELNAADLVAAREEAVAQREVADADLRHAERELAREMKLVNRNAGTTQKLDTWRHDLELARARRALAEASIRRFDALIEKTRIVAPITGMVIARHADPGETLEAGAEVVTIVDLDRLRIEAEVDELDIPRVALGSRVAVTAEGYVQTWKGSVEELPDSVTGRRMRPEDPGRPIDARVLPVKVALGDKTPLKLGQRVDLEIAVGESVAGR